MIQTVSFNLRSGSMDQPEFSDLIQGNDKLKASYNAVKNVDRASKQIPDHLSFKFDENAMENERMKNNQEPRSPMQPI